MVSQMSTNPQRSARARRAVVTVLAAVLTLLSATAWAGHDEDITVDFLGFGANPDFFALVQKDPVAGDTLMVCQVGVPTPVTAVPLEGTSAKKALKSPQIAPYNIGGTASVEGATAPPGYTLVGAAVGAQFQLSLTKDGQQGTLGYAPIVTDPTGNTVAQMTIKKVHWTQDGLRVVIILHQKLGGEWPMDSDTWAAFTLTAAQ